MNIKIDKNININNYKSFPKIRYNWDKLKIGDSFLIPAIKKCSVTTSFWYWQLDPRNKKFKIAIRPVSNSKMRVWLQKK